MVFAYTQQEVHTKIDLSVLASFVSSTTDVAKASEPEHKDISIGEEYKGLILQMPRQVASIEYTAFSENVLTQKLEDVSGRVSELHIPKQLEWLVRTHPVLTNQVRTLLQTLWAIVVSRAEQLRFPLNKTVVSIFTDPTEEESKAILQVTCHASASQALAFWDSLEPDLQGWLNNLTEHEHTVFVTKISLGVYWL